MTASPRRRPHCTWPLIAGLGLLLLLALLVGLCLPHPARPTTWPAVGQSRTRWQLTRWWGWRQDTQRITTWDESPPSNPPAPPCQAVQITWRQYGFLAIATERRLPLRPGECGL